MASKIYFDPVDSKVNFPELEEKILKYWKKERIFEKSVAKNKGKEPFVFYEGPPTANGKPGVHHVEARVFKDLIPRYKTMQGFYCERKAGWDCHGLPVEIEVEKKLGISGKPQIEEFGIEKFCQMCRQSVYEYVSDWEKMTERIGYWVDMGQAYETLDNKYIESAWWILKQVWSKGLLYEDYKVVPYCSRCGTSLSSHELAMGYKDDVVDPSIFVKFKLKDRKNTYFLAWTTTPWTLPGNVALAVDANANYVEVETEEGNLILAAKRKEDLGIEGRIVNKFEGKDLLNLEYEPLYSFIKYDKKAHFVVPADFVSLEEGTGIVHTAVMYGEDDFELGNKFGLPKKHLVNEKGEFVKEVTPWAGKFVKKTDTEIIADLENRKLLFKSETIKHTYPFCWRCGTPLLYYALTSWYLKTTAVKDNLIANNNAVNWIPAHIKAGRMGEWLANNRDWALSRNRYWGTPLPIWKCSACENEIVVGSIEELSKLSGKDRSKTDLHKPFVDEITIKCTKCTQSMKRVPFVLDCWYDSGAMPFAQWHYPFENEDKFEKNFPADYISEAIDQTRGWFYTLLAVSTLLGKGTSYKNVICLGHVLDEKGNKMSKSKGNIVDPWTVLNEAGADGMRWYFYSVITPGESFRFSVNLVKDINRRFLLILWNIYNYFVTYANLNGWSPKGSELAPSNILDKWIMARLKGLSFEVTKKLDSYDIFTATATIESFVQDFSTWYIRRSRGRSDPNFYETTHFVLVSLSKLIAPFMPFVADEMFKNLTKEDSVHLSSWTRAEKPGVGDLKLLSNMAQVRQLAEKAHSLRKKAGVALRQPLSSLSINVPLAEELKNILKDEVNVKNIVEGEAVSLDTKITADLKAEGDAREIIRSIQGERKKLATALDEKIRVYLPDWPKEFAGEIKKRALVSEIRKGDFKVERISK